MDALVDPGSDGRGILRDALVGKLRGNLEGVAKWARAGGFRRCGAFLITSLFADGYGVFGLGKVLA